MNLRDFLAVTGLIAALALASVAGLPEAFGAHPWWAARIGVVGSLIGAACLLALQYVGLKTAPLLWGAAKGLALSSAAAVSGKRVSAASFAESALAGRFWFFGWFGILSSLVRLIAAVGLYPLRGRNLSPFQKVRVEAIGKVRLHDLEIGRQVEVARSKLGMVAHVQDVAPIRC